VAVPTSFRPWEDSFEHLTLSNDPHSESADLEEYHRNVCGLERGQTLSQLSHYGSLYTVEFKAGRKDIFYAGDDSPLLKRGDLVIVEADRGKDLGKITNDSTTPMQVQALALEYAEANTASAAIAFTSGQPESPRAPREIHPKRIFRTAHTSEIAQLVSKSYDENKALIACQSRVRQKKLPMEVVDAEFQW
jgi:cell fate regulator YaaT (PSP1 superfamily)